MNLRFTLVADGLSDRALIPILTWLLHQHCGKTPVHGEIADLGRLPDPPRELSDRISRSVQLHPCDLVFVHRDAEGESIEKRTEEIFLSVQKSGVRDSIPAVCVIPIRMPEAWLLINDGALRRAAGNPNGSMSLNMPDVAKLEDLPNPKKTLRKLMRRASGLRGRRLRKFERDLNIRAQQVANLIGDFGSLRRLTGFREVEGEIRKVVKEKEWGHDTWL